jgi:hypothetical protein
VSFADYLAGYAIGAASALMVVGVGALAVARKTKEVDAWFNRVTDPVPSHVRIITRSET